LKALHLLFIFIRIPTGDKYNAGEERWKKNIHFEPLIGGEINYCFYSLSFAGYQSKVLCGGRRCLKG